MVAPFTLEQLQYRPPPRMPLSLPQANVPAFQRPNLDYIGALKAAEDIRNSRLANA